MQSNRDAPVVRHREVDQKREKHGENVGRTDIPRLEERLLAEREERGRLELEREKLRRERETFEEQRERERGRALCCGLPLVNEDRFKCIWCFHRTPEGLTERTVPLLTKIKQYINSQSHLFIIVSFRVFWDDKRTTRASGTGGFPV